MRHVSPCQRLERHTDMHTRQDAGHRAERQTTRRWHVRIPRSTDTLCGACFEQCCLTSTNFSRWQCAVRTRGTLHPTTRMHQFFEVFMPFLCFCKAIFCEMVGARFLLELKSRVCDTNASMISLQRIRAHQICEPKWTDAVPEHQFFSTLCEDKQHYVKIPIYGLTPID